ncbi:hypothetical protein CRUP_018402, partial [Coryphaenoides rupestris]
IPTLVHELILVEVWKQKVFPILCQLQDFQPKSTFPLYIVIHHEATVINLLETIMFHKDRHSVSRIAGDGASSMQELKAQNAALEFEISLKALSVLRYITDHTDSISVINRMLCTHNLPCVLVQLTECCPWSRYREGQLEKYMNGTWQKIAPEDHVKMSKLDGQVWLSLYNLLLKEDCQRKYDFNNYNKNCILKVFSELALSIVVPKLFQCSLFSVRCDFLGSLPAPNPAPPKKGLILEQIPEMWNHIVHENVGKWKAIAKYQVKETFNPSENDLRQQAQRLAQTYSLDVMESLIPEKPKCGCCGHEAVKRCSRCQGEWYCNRECQVKHWAKHKAACKLMAEASEGIQNNLNHENV